MFPFFGGNLTFFEGGKDAHKNSEGWQGQKRRRTLDRIGEAESVVASVFVPDRTPDTGFRRLFCFDGAMYWC
jgi:hypothetical protein